MLNQVTINGVTLSESAIKRIEMLQDDNASGFKDQKETLSLLLIEVVQQNFGDDRWTQFAKALADEIDFINTFQITRITTD